MRRDWLEGHLEGVEPRAELALLQEALRAALAEGEEVARLVQAVVQLDPVAGAELVVGARAVAHPAVVRGVLPVAAELEPVLRPAALYRRLVDLAPETLAEVIRAAAARHLDADWWWRLSMRERPPGTTAFGCVAQTQPDRAPYRALDHGCARVVEIAAGRGEVASLRAIYDRAERERLLRALTEALAVPGPPPVVAWMAAWHGPDIDPLFAAVARRLERPDAQRALRRMASDLPQTLAALG